MTDLKVCRICLAKDVKLHYIEGLLEIQAISLFGFNSLSSPNITLYACYECTWMIRKFSKLKEKYVTAQSILNDVLQNKKYISEDSLEQINREALCLQSRISLHKLPSISFYEGIKEDAQTDLDIMVGTDVIDCKVTDENVFNEDNSLNQVVIDKNHRKKSRRRKEDRRKHKEKSVLSKFKIVSKEKLNSMGNDNDLLKDFVIKHLTHSEQLAEVEKRKNSPNYKDSPYHCDICYKGFLQIDTLNNHTVRHEPVSGDILCDVCKFRFRTVRAHALHVARHTRKFSCTRCNFVTVHIDQAKKHKQWHDGVTYKCQYCNEVSNKLTSHLSHIRMKHTSEFVCELCGYSFVSEKGLKMHKTRMHSMESQYNDSNVKVKAELVDSSLYCKECDLQFMTSEAWKRHQVTSAKHRDNIGTACRTCGESFPSASRLRSHVRSHATAATALALARARASVARRRYIPRDRRDRNPSAAPGHSYPSTCEHCSETMTDRSCHWRHYQRHHRDKKYPLSQNNYICEYCGKGFQANAFLVYHKRTHSEERSYECSSCPKSFHTTSSLRAHTLTHSALRPHSCAFCYNTFKTKLGLQQHIKRHSGLRPFSCQYCEKSFSRASCLTLHVTKLHAKRMIQDKDPSKIISI